jgi:excisionase family DNA binding protein
VSVVRGLGKHSEVVLEPLLLRPIEVAQLLGIGRSRAYELIAAGDIPGVMRVGRSVRVSLVALRAWINEQTAPPAVDPTPAVVEMGKQRRGANQARQKAVAPVEESE